MAYAKGPPPTPRYLHHTFDAHSGPVHVVRYAKGAAKYILSGGQDRTIRLFNPEQGTEIKTYKGHGYEVLSLTITADNSKFASGGGDRSVFYWDISTGQTIRRLAGHMGRINAVEFNTDASVLASGSYDGKVNLWDLRAQGVRTPIQTLDEAHDSVTSVYVASHMIYTGSVDGHVRTYDMRKGELRADYLGYPVTSVLPTADLQTVLATILDSKVILLDDSAGTALATFTGHRNKEYRSRAAFGHQEASVICGDEDGRIWAWDLLDSKPLGENPPRKVHNKVITWVEQHPVRAGELVSASGDGTVKVWRLQQKQEDV
ncbi:nuclear mRNA splicing protein [Dacryopinax primogenitus]|uniref:Nuclear mRNA splicing protein n=1 Tax=Dacryopinax primogenitus (strain DJM 731) TaxID=1858805 RepID=M5FS75_DACPD|nr:nuclear mRNA splicing protein [Dacryopinax primogenitus]EJT98009.1 nuclear mRNA splicing protein [Dacryopinax primogenitus]